MRKKTEDARVTVCHFRQLPSAQCAGFNGYTHGGENPPIASTIPPTLYFVHLVDAGTVRVFWANMARGRMPALAEQLGMKKVLHHGGAACRGRYQISSMLLVFTTRSLGLEKEMRACWPPSWPRPAPAEDIVLLGSSTAAAGEAELNWQQTDRQWLRVTRSSEHASIACFDLGRQSGRLTMTETVLEIMEATANARICQLFSHCRDRQTQALGARSEKRSYLAGQQ